MLYFPQLYSGATAQYPFVKRRIYRTITSAAPDGRMLKLGDPAWSMAEWELTIRNALEPGANRTGDVLQHAWKAGSASSPFSTPPTTCWSGAGTWQPRLGPRDRSSRSPPDRPIRRADRKRRSVSNAGAGTQSVQQTIEGPGWFHYCFSFYASSEQPLSLAVFRFTGGVEVARSYPVDSRWKRLALSGRSQGAQESITFGISLEAGAAVNVYGMQVEAQPAPSAYRKTTSRSGVHANARFNDDVLDADFRGARTALLDNTDRGFTGQLGESCRPSPT